MKTFEQLYPTKHAREKADAATDALPLTASMADHIALWESVYQREGGIVKMKERRR